MPRSLVFILVPFQCFAFLDFLGERAAKVAEAAAYTDAISEMLSEVSNDSELSIGAKDLSRRTNILREEIGELSSLGYSTQSILEGPDWSSKRLLSNIRSTTDYVRRVKRFMIRLALLGTEGATAFNTAETNFALNEVQKNQQAMILQFEDQKIRTLEKETLEAKKWNAFSKTQRSLRNTVSQEHGKLQ